MSTIDYNQLITDQSEGVEFGQIQLTLKIHRGELSKVDTAKATYVKIDGSNPDADAAGIILSVLRAQAKKTGDGSLGFSVLYRKDKPVQVQVQEFIPSQLS